MTSDDLCVPRGSRTPSIDLSTSDNKLPFIYIENEVHTITLVNLTRGLPFSDKRSVPMFFKQNYFHAV